LQVIGFLKGVGRALEASLSLLCPLIFAGVYMDVQNLVQETVRIPTHSKKVDVALLLEQLRAVLGQFTPDSRAMVAQGANGPVSEARVAQPSAAQVSADWI
jgi:hypothetical protein